MSLKITDQFRKIHSNRVAQTSSLKSDDESERSVHSAYGIPQQELSTRQLFSVHHSKVASAYFKSCQACKDNKKY